MARFNAGMTLTSSEAAELLGVHPSTVKRWCNDGELPSDKTEGGHRRIHVKEAQALARDRGIQTVLTPFHPYEPHVWSALRAVEEEGSFRRFLTLAMGWVHRAQLRRLGHLVEAVARQDSVPFHRFCDEAVRGLMVEVGRAWHQGRLRAGEEHMVSQVMVDVLLKLRREEEDRRIAAGETGGALALVGTMEGNQHHLGALCVRLLLERAGWDVLYLGPDVPVEDFGVIQRGRRAELVCISLTPPVSPGETGRALRVLSEFYDPGLPYDLVLGGHGPDDPDLEAVASGPFRRVELFSSCAQLQEALERGPTPTQLAEATP